MSLRMHGARWGLLLLAGLSIGACESTCDPSRTTCEGNDVVACECEGISCSSGVRESCGDGTMCRERDRRAACVLSDETCPPEHRGAGQYCEDNAVKTCFGEYLIAASPCAGDSVCFEDGDEARCLDWTPPCVTADVSCESARAFRICIGTSWGPRNFCPEGTACDPTQRTAPCVALEDAGSPSESDGG